MKLRLYSLIAVCAVVFPLTVHANGFYLGAGLVTAELEGKNEAGSSSASGNSAGLTFALGYEVYSAARFSFALEANYTRLQNQNLNDDRNDGLCVDSPSGPHLCTVDYIARVQALGSTPLSDKLDLIFGLGYAFTKGIAATSPGGRADTRLGGPSGSLGLAYSLPNDHSIRALLTHDNFNNVIEEACNGSRCARPQAKATSLQLSYIFNF